MPHIDLRFDMRCLDVDLAAGLVLRDERSGATTAKLSTVLLGADGARSAVRTALAARDLLQAQE